MATRTALETITRALRRIGIIAEMEAPSAEQGAEALIVLNDMMNGFNSQGIQYSHTDLALADTLNVPDDQTRNVLLLLCSELADEYGKELSTNLGLQVMNARQALQAAYYSVPLAEPDPGLENRIMSWSGSIERI